MDKEKEQSDAAKARIAADAAWVRARSAAGAHATAVVVLETTLMAGGDTSMPGAELITTLKAAVAAWTEAIIGEVVAIMARRQTGAHRVHVCERCGGFGLRAEGQSDYRCSACDSGEPSVADLTIERRYTK